MKNFKFKKPKEKNSIIFGVCSTLSETFGWGLDVVRLGFIFTFFVNSSIIYLYLALAVFIAVFDTIDEAVSKSDSDIVTEKNKIDPEKVKEAEVISEEDVKPETKNDAE